MTATMGERMAVRIAVLAVISVLVLGGLFLILRPDPPAASALGERSVDLEITEDGMSPEEVSVREGDRVTLGITSDRPVEIHVHGYDLAEVVEPGEPTELSFEPDLTGRFPM